MTEEEKIMKWLQENPGSLMAFVRLATEYSYILLQSEQDERDEQTDGDTETVLALQLVNLGFTVVDADGKQL